MNTLKANKNEKQFFFYLFLIKLTNKTTVSRFYHQVYHKKGFTTTKVFMD